MTDLPKHITRTVLKVGNNYVRRCYGQEDVCINNTYRNIVTKTPFVVEEEGPTEFFYFKSLCDVFKRLTIKPDYPKHTNLKELEAKIEEGIAMGYSHIITSIQGARITAERFEPVRDVSENNRLFH